MKSSIIACCLIFGLLGQGMALSTDVIFNGRAGTALNALTIYSDSTFTKPSFASFTAGQLLEIIGETDLEHEDDAQNQTFKWYKVQDDKGRAGWVFGDGLAIVIPQEDLGKEVLAYHKKKIKLGTGFENAVVWMAAIEGHDNFHANALLNPIYQEAYIVITNHRGKSVHVYYGGESTQGVSGLEEIEFQELTGDLIPELVLLKNQESIHQKEMVKNLELYSFQAGTLKKVFEERLNLEETKASTAPFPYKFVELDQGTIRVEYLETKSCGDYSLPLRTGILGESPDKCLEYVTYTYHWDKPTKQYQLLYQENRSAPQVQLKREGIVLQSAPNAAAPRIGSIRPGETLDVIRQHEEWSTTRTGNQSKETYFYVRVKEGLYGYIPMRYTNFVNTTLAKSLDEYYRNPSTSKATKTVSCFSIRRTDVDSSAYNH